MTLQIPFFKEFPKRSDNFVRAWRAEFHPEKLFPSLTAGLVTGAIGIIRAISYAALIFSGSLAAGLNVGIGMAIFSSAAISIVVALTSSLPGAIATPLAAPTAVLAVLAAGLADSLAPVATAREILLTVVAAIAVGSLCTGAVLLLLGQLGLGNVLQIVPYPVIGGFMAGTGLLLVRGSFQVMAGLDLSLETLPALFEPSHASLWAVGAFGGVALLLATRRWQHFSVVPVCLLASIAIFYAGLLASGAPLEAARAAGWLLGPFPAGNLWQPLSAADLGLVRWEAIAAQVPNLGILVFVSLVSLVMTNNGIEQAVGRDLDLDAELRAIGLANLVAGLGSSMAGNQALPSTLLVNKMGAPNRLTGIVKALLCLVVLWLGAAFLGYFPRPILGSLLLFLGVDLLICWLYRVRPGLPWLDYLIVPVVMLAINIIGFLPGVALGFGLAVLIFLYRYGRVGAIAREYACQDSRVWVLELQGFLFFGRVFPLQQRVRELLAGSDTKPHHIICDFGSVHGLDTSAVQTFGRICQRGQQAGVTIAFATLSPELKQQLFLGGSLSCEVFPDLESSLQWCAANTQTAF